jgi:DNA-binding transcriptional LysR family regulator
VLDFEQLKTFQKLVEFKNIQRVSEELYISQSSVINRIKTLEEELGFNLLSRNVRGIQLSHQGMQFVSFVDKTVELIEKGAQEIKNSKHRPNSFTIASVPTVTTYFLPSILEKFKNIHPDVEVHVYAANTSKILDWVINGVIDVGLIRGPFQYKGVEAEKLFSDPIIPVFYKDHCWANKKYVTPIDFLKETILALDRKSSIWASIQEWFSQNGVFARVSMELDHIETTKKMILNRFGIAFVPLMAVENELAEGVLKTVEIKPPLDIYRDTLLIRHRSQPLTFYAEEFLRYTIQTVKNK